VEGHPSLCRGRIRLETWGSGEDSCFRYRRATTTISLPLSLFVLQGEVAKRGAPRRRRTNQTPANTCGYRRNSEAKLPLNRPQLPPFFC
jgi:hypothetical protein